MSPLPVALALMGPTASGKTDLALRLAEHFPVEIISVDSAQVYRHMNVGTAKPEAWMLAHVPHHLIDCIDPDQSYSAGRFRDDALALMQAISARGRLPLLCGGTMLYFNALRQGLSSLPSADAAVRAQLSARAASQGWPALHAELTRVDAASAARIAPSDAQRIQRALEVYHLTGRPLSAHHATPRHAGLSHRLIEFALLPADRAALHTRIATRFDAMLQAGLTDELADLRRRFQLTPEMSAMRCVGYRQAWQYLDGGIDAAALRDQGIAATRQLAKRQITWLRATPTATMLDPLVMDPLPPLRAALEAALA